MGPKGTSPKGSGLLSLEESHSSMGKMPLGVEAWRGYRDGRPTECEVEVHQLPLGERQEEALEEDNGFAKTGIEVVMGGIEQVPLAFGADRGRIVQLFGGICSRIFLSQRSQFLHKISTLLELVENLNAACSNATEELNDPSSVRPEREWDLLDASHYDLNTCLRETIVLLKCFLLALPEGQLVDFNAALHGSPIPVSSPLLDPKRHLAHRRMTLLKGQ